MNTQAEIQTAFNELRNGTYSIHFNVWSGWTSVNTIVIRVGNYYIGPC